MKKFQSVPFDKNGGYIVERWNEVSQQYERHYPKDDVITKDESVKRADECNHLVMDSITTIDEYVDGNYPFYHVTPMEKLDGILERGLLAGRRVPGVCVVRCRADEIIAEIISRILHTQNVADNTEFAIIKLTPKKHNFNAHDIAEDSVDEPIAPICNYICKDNIPVTESDIIKKNIPIRIYDCVATSFPRLTGYYREPLPPIPHI